MSAAPLRHELLRRAGVEHGFGVRSTPAPAGVRRPRQVHGVRIVTAADCAGTTPPDADGVVSVVYGVPVGVVTADCLPVLLAAENGSAVAAVHAGWRGLAGGVIEAGVDALRHATGNGIRIVGVVGPHIGSCCYEVDAPVLDALDARYSGALSGATRETRPGHALLDLGELARGALGACGIEAGAFPGTCTRCDAELFHSYRRDGPRAGRLLHHIAAGDEAARQA